MSFAIPTLLLQSYNPDAFSKVCSFEGDVTRGNGKSVEYALKIGIAWLVTLLISSGVGFYCTYQVRKHVRTTNISIYDLYYYYIRLKLFLPPTRRLQHFIHVLLVVGESNNNNKGEVVVVVVATMDIFSMKNFQLCR